MFHNVLNNIYVNMIYQKDFTHFIYIINFFYLVDMHITYITKKTRIRYDSKGNLQIAIFDTSDNIYIYLFILYNLDKSYSLSFMQRISRYDFYR